MHSGEKWSQTTIDSDTLIERLRAPDDQDAWRQVDQRYGVLLIAFAARMGLPPDQCRDARQETMLAFVKTIRAGRFDRSRGRLRDLLFSIAKNKIVENHKRRGKQDALLEGESEKANSLVQVPDNDGWLEAWESEWQVAVAAQCLKEAQEKFKPETYLAFYLKAIEDLPSAEVARKLGKTVNAVDIAVSRVRGFLRQIRPAIEELF